jgi:hypothetical protein
MRKCFLILLNLVVIVCAGQIVFSPPGAKWHYSFTMLTFAPPAGSVVNNKITYDRDSIIGVDTVKVLKTTRFFTQCSSYTPFTLIKQKGDTIFMQNNRTQNTWQILYNFAAIAGQNWKTTFLDDNNTVKTYTISVDTVKYITINSFLLKQLIVHYTNQTGSGSAKITERFGCNQFMFTYSNYTAGFCDYDYFNSFLCYEDSTFGLKQFTNKPCDYSYYVGLKENDNGDKLINIYPNPTSDILNLDFNNIATTENYFVKITNLLGQIVQETKLEKTLNISSIKNGIYFLQVFDKENLIATEKIIKE